MGILNGSGPNGPAEVRCRVIHLRTRHTSSTPGNRGFGDCGKSWRRPERLRNMGHGDSTEIAIPIHRFSPAAPAIVRIFGDVKMFRVMAMMRQRRPLPLKLFLPQSASLPLDLRLGSSPASASRGSSLDRVRGMGIKFCSFPVIPGTQLLTYNRLPTSIKS